MVGLSALAFLMAVLASAFADGSLFGTLPEAYSRASSNLALLAIACTVALRGGSLSS